MALDIGVISGKIKLVTTGFSKGVKKVKKGFKSMG